MMEQLDYEGMFASETSPTWLLPPFDQQDATFLSTSRQMLEPIMEETSEDEETQNWSQFESVWSSESDTGSVIRIELHNDQDSISERDFACPAKRPRRDDLLVVEEIPPIRKFNRNENLLLPEIPENITYRKRFDELYSDSDSISYNSLSRSSSLIQFESLERQLQGDHSSMGSASIRNSSPSLTTFENGESKMSSDGCLRRYESTDGRLHQTYFDLAKIEFNNDLIFRAKSDSESSDNSILSHEERILKPTNLNSASDQRACYKGKNSAENLSEDSGYCEHITALRIKSKSIPNFLRSNDKFCEEDEFENHKSLEMIYKSGSDDNDVGLNSRENAEQENKRELKTKIAAKHEADRRGWYNSEGDILLVDVKNKIHTNNAMAASSSSSRSSSPPPPSSSSTSSSPTSFKTSSSLPDVRLQFDHAFDATNNCSRDREHDQFSISDCERKTDSAQLRAVSSVPKNLNLTGSNDLPGGNDDDYIWNLRSPKFARSENRSSGGKRYGALRLSPVKPAQNFINASYNNLTLLDYSGKSNRNSFTMSDHSGNSKRNSREFELGKGNFLLDEISSHFDRNLSILSDREHDSDMISEFLRREVEIEENGVDLDDVDEAISDEVIPAVTLRQSNSAREQTNSCEVAQVHRKNASLESFDVDPTNVHTNYSESLESCDFDPMGMSKIDLDHSTPVKRGFVASTPNLTTFKSTPDDTEDDDFEFHGSSAHNSLNPIPGEKRLGILLTSGSRNSLGKGVSFCPIVSEISFREQSSEEAADSFDNADAESSIDRIDQTDRTTDQVDHQQIIPTSSSDRVGVQQVRDVNSEIINNPDCTEPDREPVRFYERSSSAASNVSTVEQFGVADFSYDIPVTVEMLCSELNNEVVIVPPTKINSNCDDRASDSREKVLQKNNNNYANSGNGSGIGNHNCNQNNNRKMPNIEANSVKQLSAGTDLLSAKFKPKPDEKHHKNGFLSRFTGGFRFSLRRKKKPAIDKNTNDLIIKQQPQQQLAKPSSSKKTPDYVYIPLKGPNPKSMTETPEPRTPPCKTITTERHLPLGGCTNNGDKNHVLLVGKPPLPKQPPRVIGVCEKIRASQQQHSPVNFYNGNGRHAQVIRSKSQPREIDESFLDNERQFYDSNQLIGTMNGNGSSVYLPAEDFPVRPQQQYGNNGPAGSKATTLPTNSTNKIGLIETDLDTHETVISGKTRSLMELGPQIRHPLSGHTDRNSHHRPNVSNIIDGATTRRPHKSMEFLLDKENQKNVLPPENELQKSHDSTTALSEHQLRVQASLQRLNIPDWFRQYSSTPKPTETGYKPGFNRKRASDSGRWTGLNSKTTSLSSLGSQRSDRSPLMLSPSAHSHHGGQTGFSRWSTSHLNSNQTSPSVSTRGSFSRGAAVNSSFVSGHSVGGVSVRNSFRQPYLGWRSQEKLAQPRTPHERLASSLLAQQQAQKKEPPVTPEIQSSIKEVTSAIVHYVNDQTNRTSSRSRSTSPNSRKCWVESSFVGIRPVESPQTPIIENSFSANTTGSVAGTTSTAAPSDILRMNGVGESTVI